MPAPTFHLGELVYLTNRLARGSPDTAYTERSGPGMIVRIIEGPTPRFKPRYRVRWLKSGAELTFHGDVLMSVEEPQA
jgi:hypothetical protein